MNVLVLGGTGFIGRHVVAGLSGLGAVVTTGGRSRDGVGADHVEVDARAEESVRAAFGAVGPEVVVFAVRSAAPESDVAAARSVVAAATDAGVARVVVVSSAAVYGVRPADVLERASEGAERRGTSDYARAKIAVEDVFTGVRGPEVSIMRVFNVVGPGEPTSLVARSLLTRISAGEDPLVVDNAAATRDFVDVRDAAAAVAKAAVDPPPWPLINVCSGQSTTIGSLAVQCAAVLGADTDLHFGPGGDASLGDAGRALRWGWYPRRTLASALVDSVQEMRGSP